MIQTISEFSRNEIATFYGYPKDRVFVAPPAPASIFKPFGLEARARDARPCARRLSVGLPKHASELVQDGSLRFLGMVPDARLRDLYEGTVALLFPSLYQGFGMPVVEAMSCGAHVIHSASTSMDEISADIGIRLPATDIAAWTDAMRHAIEVANAQNATATRQQRIAQARR